MPSVILPVSGQNSLLNDYSRSGHTLILKLRTQVGNQVKDTLQHTHANAHPHAQRGVGWVGLSHTSQAHIGQGWFVARF